MKMIKDNPTVTVFNGNIDQALRIFKQKINNSKTFATLKRRALYPNAAARRRAKVLMTLQRKRKGR